jgi:tetratricopeptide (TPR) repeat protein
VRRRRDSSVDGELEYVFGHVLVREVAYGGIVRARRGEAHLRAGQWTDRLRGNRSDRAETVAHHYESALVLGASGTDPGLRARTAEAVRNAAMRALGLHAHERAAELFGRALELYSHESPERPRLLLSRAVALALGDRPAAEALHEASTALVAAGEAEGAAEAESMAGWLLALAGRMERAREADGRALDLVMGRPASPAKALVLCRAGTHRIFAPDLHEEGAHLLNEALKLARSQGLEEIEAEALQFAGMGRIHAGDLNGAADVDRALALALQLNSVVSLSCYGNLADVRKRLGDLRGAAQLHTDGLRAAMRFGMPVQVRRFRAEQVAHLYWRGAWDEATRAADAYLATIEEGSPHQMEAEMRIFRGRMRLARGDAAGALADAEGALSFARLTGHPYDVLPALAFRARVELHEGARDGSALASELLEQLRPDQVFWAAWGLPDAVVVLTAVGKAAELVDRLSAARMKTPWDAAAVAHAEGRFDDSAAVYAEMGAQPEEAATRLLAGRPAPSGTTSTPAL